MRIQRLKRVGFINLKFSFSGAAKASVVMTMQCVADVNQLPTVRDTGSVAIKKGTSSL